MKKFISLFLVVSVLALSMPLTAKEKKGADPIIQRTDGTQVRGELIAVKENSVLLLEREAGADVSVDIGDVRVITNVKKSKSLLGAGFGFFVGAALGTIAGSAAFSEAAWGQLSIPEGKRKGAAIGGVIGGLAGALVGGLIGASAGKDVTIQIEGKSDSEVQEILEELRKKARVRNAQ